MSADVTVNLNTTYQNIDGFGAMQDKGWTGYNMTSADYNTAFGTGPGQIGLTILRIRANESQSAWGSDLVDAKAAYSRGVKVFATAWACPSSMRTPYTFTRGGTTTYDSYKLSTGSEQAYADHLNAFAKYMKDNNVPLYALGFKNEPDWCDEWACGSATEMYNYAKNYGSKLRQNGNKVISAESFNFSKSYYDPILNDAAALSSIDILGTHFYGTSKSSGDNTFDYTLFKQKGGKTPFWMTEVYTANVNNQGSKAWPLCLDVAYEMHRALALSNMSAYVWWYMKRTYGPLWISANNSSAAASAGTVSKVGAIMGQYSKYVRPGAVRVDATRKVQTDVYTSAFKKNDSVVVVSVNMASSAKTVTYSISGMKATSGVKITTSGTKDMKDDGTVPVTGGNFSVTLEAQSISTIVFSGNGTTSIDANRPSAVDATPGAYDVYGPTGAFLGQVQLSEGQSLATKVGALSSHRGLYFAKSVQGGQPIPVVRP
jgi:glucuronoarabinoxylan endo-1,4-beta-xylanase